MSYQYPNSAREQARYNLLRAAEIGADQPWRRAINDRTPRTVPVRRALVYPLMWSIKRALTSYESRNEPNLAVRVVLDAVTRWVGDGTMPYADVSRYDIADISNALDSGTNNTELFHMMTLAVHVGRFVDETSDIDVVATAASHRVCTVLAAEVTSVHEKYPHDYTNLQAAYALQHRIGVVHKDEQERQRADIIRLYGGNKWMDYPPDSHKE